jgi:hypothetical protein
MIEYAQARIESAAMFAEQRTFAALHKVEETTPQKISHRVLEFAHRLGGEPPIFVPVVHDDVGLFGYCDNGVRERVRLSGGTAAFGWCIWEWPRILLTAEFHTVWQTPDGQLVDITPKPHGETSIVFIQDRRYADDFDFDKRPPSLRFSLYPAVTRTEIAEQSIASMRPAQLEYERKRASKAGEPLTEYLGRKIPPDRNSAAVDEFIEIAGRIDALLETVPGTGPVEAPPGYAALAKRKLILQGLMQKLGRRE